MLWNLIDERYREGTLQLPQGPKKLELHEMEDLMIQCSRQLSKTFLFLDALNESKESSRISQTLLRILQEAASLQIMMSSTEELGTNLTLYPAVIVSFEQEKTAGDIKKYVEAWLQHDDYLCGLPPALKHDIKSALQGRANGVYCNIISGLQTLGTNHVLGFDGFNAN